MQLISHSESLQNSVTRHARRNLFLVILESAITAGLLSMSVMSPFFFSIGMTQPEIALSQAVFTVLASVLSLPAGWIADRFSRKWANIVGDFGEALVFLCYSRANGFWSVVVCECALGFFNALSQGVDFSLLRHFSNQVIPSSSFFRKQSAKLSLYQNCCTFFLVLLGGPIGAINFRLAIALSSVPYFIGGMASLFIIDDSEQLKPDSANPMFDIWRIIKDCAKNQPLRVRILVYAIGREMTHGIIWIYTPLLLYAKIPLGFVSCAWAINSLCAILGSRLAVRYAYRFKPWQLLAFPLAVQTISMGALSIWISPWSIWVYFLMGIVQGWTGATLLPLVQDRTHPTEQTSVISLAKVIGQVIYIPVVCLIGFAADLDLHLAPLTSLLIFTSVGAVLVYKLRRE